MSKESYNPGRYPHGQVIYDLMKEKKYKGRFKDYAILSGNMMMDYNGSYQITRVDDTGGEGNKEAIVLIHKKWLYRFVTESELFWSHKLGMRKARHAKAISKNT